jgi:nitroimidazol reductase NimA-like FMN-containing flavoprotein (pyridoxamine 5'-phosphate oxidase superfamily)
MQKYHLRRAEKKIKKKEVIYEIINRQEYLTIALCKNNQPYIVSLNYGFDSNEMCFYFHCASEGKKIDFLRSNPIVYGQILEELKYKEGECAYAYRSVQFEGKVIFLENIDEKKNALNLMIEKIETSNLVEKTKEKHITNAAVEKVFIGKIIVKEFTGKEELL